MSRGFILQYVQEVHEIKTFLKIFFHGFCFVKVVVCSSVVSFFLSGGNILVPCFSLWEVYYNHRQKNKSMGFWLTPSSQGAPLLVLNGVITL